MNSNKNDDEQKVIFVQAPENWSAVYFKHDFKEVDRGEE